MGDRQSFHRFGPFILGRTLGRGGMGEVSLARSPWPDAPVCAVKRLRPDVARVSIFVERFQHEAELAVRLSHPNIVGTLDVGSVDGNLYVCSELVLGKDTAAIADRLAARGQGGPIAVGLRLLLDILAGLAYVHGAREPDGRSLALVHRDVTPGNVLVGYDGIARLADFGLAKSVLTSASGLTKHGEILGTPSYLAPEVISGDQAGVASDLYGLGAVMYRFFSGVPPHQGTVAETLAKVLSGPPKSIAELRPDLPDWIVEVVHQLLSPDPNHRPRSANALLKRLGAQAQARRLLVPHASVARWLGDLFEIERLRELEERDRLRWFDPNSIPEGIEHTIVLAPRAISRLEAPSDVAFGVESSLSGEGEDAPRIDDGPLTTSMRARKTPKPAEDDPAIEDTYIVGERSPRAWDEVARLASEAHLASSADLDHTLLEPSGQPPTLIGAFPPTIEAIIEGSQRRDATETLELDASQTETASSPAASEGPSRREAAEGGWRTPRIVALFVAAVILGLVLGVVLSMPPRRAEVGEAAVLRDRLTRLKSEMDARRARGETVPVRAWELVGETGLDLVNGQEARAKARLVEIEGLLVR